MKQTAVEWLEDCLTEQHPNGSFVWNTRADLEALFKQAKKLEKQKMIEMHDKGFDSVVQLNDDYAIGFAEWTSYKYKYLETKGWFGNSYDLEMGIFKSSKQLLEIYKKEKGL